MDKEFKRLKEIRDKDRKADDDTRELIARLDSKLSDIENEIQEARGLTEQTRETKERALTLFAVDEATQGDVDRARRALESAEKAEAEPVEMVNAIINARATAVSKLPTLNRDRQVAERQLWAFIYHEKIKPKIQETIGDLVRKAWCSHMGASGGSYEHILVDLFGRAPAPEETREIRAEVEKEYGI